jgi:predicted nucleic acid-binding protein
MGTGYLLDSNVVIDYLDNKLPSTGMTLVSGMVDQTPHISVITQIEILRFNAEPDVLGTLSDFVDCCVVYPLDDEVVRVTIALCRRHKIKLPDAIIAATAILQDFTLITRNVDDFKSIEALQIQNPWN